MHVWEIINENSFGMFSPLVPRNLVRLYVNREKAEEAVSSIVKLAHKYSVEETIRDQESGLGNLTKKELAWWKSGPPITTHRTEDTTFYCCGEHDWDSRDRRGAAYGWIKRREVVE